MSNSPSQPSRIDMRSAVEADGKETKMTVSAAGPVLPGATKEPSPPTPEQQREEIDRLRSERNALAAQIARRGHRHDRGQWFRRTLAAVLVLLFALLLPLATALGWAHRTVFNADRY